MGWQPQNTLAASSHKMVHKPSPARKDGSQPIQRKKNEDHQEIEMDVDTVNESSKSLICNAPTFLWHTQLVPTSPQPLPSLCGL